MYTSVDQQPINTINIEDAKIILQGLEIDPGANLEGAKTTLKILKTQVLDKIETHSLDQKKIINNLIININEFINLDNENLDEMHKIEEKAKNLGDYIFNNNNYNNIKENDPFKDAKLRFSLSKIFKQFRVIVRKEIERTKSAPKAPAPQMQAGKVENLNVENKKPSPERAAYKFRSLKDVNNLSNSAEIRNIPPQERLYHFLLTTIEKLNRNEGNNILAIKKNLKLLKDEIESFIAIPNSKENENLTAKDNALKDYLSREIESTLDYMKNLNNDNPGIDKLEEVKKKVKSIADHIPMEKDSDDYFFFYQLTRSTLRELFNKLAGVVDNQITNSLLSNITLKAPASQANEALDIYIADLKDEKKNALVASADNYEPSYNAKAASNERNYLRRAYNAETNQCARDVYLHICDIMELLENMFGTTSDILKNGQCAEPDALTHGLHNRLDRGLYISPEFFEHALSNLKDIRNYMFEGKNADFFRSQERFQDYEKFLNNEILYIEKICNNLTELKKMGAITLLY